MGAGLVFGLALSVASTAVLVRTMQERRLVDTERGRIAVGWLIVEDLAMVLALVLLPALAGVLGGQPQVDDHASLLSLPASDGIWGIVGITLAKVAAFVVVMLVVGRRVIPWIMHYVAHTGSRERFRLSVLAIALGVAFGAAKLFGVSLALGAFFAGMIISESELSHRAAEESLPLRDAFSVLFFVSVGMLFDPLSLISNGLPILATLAIIVIGKSLAAFVIVIAFRYPIATALMISASRGGLKLAEVEEPRPFANEALVSVHASSLNRGELRLLAIRPNGFIPGQDVVGIVERAAADGSGPAVGTRVVALIAIPKHLRESWAERVAIPTDRLAVLPDDVSFASAATLPVAGTTALRTLRHGGDLAGQQVLITGASGAVGRFQIQIAHQQGGRVTAVAAARHGDDLRGLGAEQIVESIELAGGPFSLITESVGGKSLAHAFERVAPGGTIVMFGSSSGELTPVGFRQFVPGHEGARLQTFAYYTSGSGIGADIASLLALVAAGRLETRVALTVSWTDIAQALDALRQRSISGKAVLTITE